MAKKVEMTIKEIKDQMSQNIMRNLYQMILGYVKNHQEEKGYLDTRAVDNKDDIFCDVFEPGQNGASGGSRVEKYVYGLKVVEDKLYIATEYCNPEDASKENWTDEDFKNESNWVLFLDAHNNIVTFPTLLCIADCIEQY